MNAAGPNGGAERQIEDLVEGLDEGTVRRVLVSAAEAHEDVARRLRLAAAGSDERLEVMRAEVDRGLRTRRHLDYWQSGGWAAEAAPVVDALGEEVARDPTDELVRLLERAAGHLVKAIERADDSNGLIGDLASRVLDLHREACAAEASDPKALAKWMIRFSFRDQDFFQVDPVAYSAALGEVGLAHYRREIAKLSAEPPGSEVSAVWAPFPSSAARYAHERLAVLDRDGDRLVELVGGDLTAPHQFVRVAEAMVEIDRPDDALTWARRGINETSGWQVAKLYDLAADLLAEGEHGAEVVELRRHQHRRTPTTTTYADLKAAATATGTWGDEIGSARQLLAEKNPSALVDALLGDDEPDAAWNAAITATIEPDANQWLRLARSREPNHPGDALAVYLRLVDETLLTADRRNYRDATRLLKAARTAAAAADEQPAFDRHLTEVREQYRRRPTLIAMLDKAGLS